jgi:hypothetical protein
MAAIQPTVTDTYRADFRGLITASVYDVESARASVIKLTEIGSENTGVYRHRSGT